MGYNGNYPLDPSGNLSHSYWKWPIETVDWPKKKMVICHSYVNVYKRLPEGNKQIQQKKTSSTGAELRRWSQILVPTRIRHRDSRNNWPLDLPLPLLRFPRPNLDRQFKVRHWISHIRWCWRNMKNLRNRELSSLKLATPNGRQPEPETIPTFTVEVYIALLPWVKHIPNQSG